MPRSEVARSDPERAGAPASSAGTSLARNRRFLAYLFAAGCADSGYLIYYVAQGWLVLGLTNSPFWLGLVAGSGQLPFLLLSLLGGSLADRFERRRLIALGNAGLALIALVLAVLVAKGAIGILVLTLLAFAIGMILAIEHPVDRAWLYDLVKGEQVGRAIALSSLEWSLARTAGPALGGIVIATIGIAAGYGLFALSVLPLVALALTLGRRSAPAHAPSSRQVPRQPSALDRIILPFSLLIAAFTIGINPYFALLPDIAKNVLHQGPGGYGILSASGGAGAIVGALALATLGEVRSKGRVIPLAMFVGAALLIGFTFTRDFFSASAFLFAMGIVDTVMYALANTYVQECAADEERGRANGIFSLAFLGGIPVGNLLVGTLAGRVGSESALALAAGVAAVVSVAFWLGAPAAREAA